MIFRQPIKTSNPFLENNHHDYCKQPLYCFNEKAPYCNVYAIYFPCIRFASVVVQVCARLSVYADDLHVAPPPPPTAASAPPFGEVPVQGAAPVLHVAAEHGWRDRRSGVGISANEGLGSSSYLTAPRLTRHYIDFSDVLPLLRHETSDSDFGVL